MVSVEPTRSSPRESLDVTLEHVPEQFRGHVNPEAPENVRLTVARAMLPMDPQDLMVVLAFLSSDSSPSVSEASSKSIDEVPPGIVKSNLGRHDTAPAVLNFYSRIFLSNSDFIGVVLLNPRTADPTIEYLAAELSDSLLLDIIAQNQVRVLRHPAIIEALYYNPEAKMTAISRVIESAARNGVNLAHIPGFREVELSILGADGLKAKRDAGEITERELEELLTGQEEVETGLEDETYQTLLRDAVQEAPEFNVSDDEDQEESKPVWQAIGDMNTSQKVRLALMGNATARRYLVRDPQRLVALSVLRSPRVTGKEITYYAQQKAISEDVIRVIAKTREWTRHYATKIALIRNPKTPSQHSMWFIKSVFPKDLKTLSKDKDIPGVVQKTAKRILAQKELKGR